MSKKINSDLTKPVSKKTQRKLKNWYFELCNYEGDPIEYVSRIYKAIDYFYEKELKQEMVCSKGCGHCCKVPVMVTSIEAYYIGRRESMDVRELLKEMRHKPDGSSCPFLKNNECSIYQNRPSVCRAFGTYDSVDYCISGETHKITTLESGSASLFGDLLFEASVQIKNEYGFAVYADIRHWFGKMS